MMSVMMFFMPETPYYLITKGKVEQAEKFVCFRSLPQVLQL
jgi:hypothetical protein